MAVDVAFLCNGLFVLLCLSCGSVFAFMDGAPHDMCVFDRANAFHTVPLNITHVGQYQPQDAKTNPYTLNVETTTYWNATARPQNVKSHGIRVTLKAPRGEYFKGFYIKAIPVDRHHGDNRTYGQFVATDALSKAMRCYLVLSPNVYVGGATHIDNSTKSEASVIWIPPMGCNLGVIQFEATVVRTYSEYWSDLRSVKVKPAGFSGKPSLACRFYRDPFNETNILQIRKEFELRRKSQAAARANDILTRKANRRAPTLPGNVRSNVPTNQQRNDIQPTVQAQTGTGNNQEQVQGRGTAVNNQQNNRQGEVNLPRNNIRG